jgi:beta-lactamase class A
MRFFGKSKENQEELVQPKKRTRRKKDEQKPWGRRERSLIFFLLIASVLTAALLAVSARAWKLPGIPRISWPSIGLSESFTIEKPQETPDFSQVKSDFKRETQDLSGVYGFYVYRLEGGESYGLYQDEIFQAASLIKLPLMLALYQEKPEGYKELVERMGKKSDNAAFQEARSILGDRKIKETILAVGMNHTSLEENETTMRDIGLFFAKLWRGELLPDSERDEILESLTDTIYEEHLAAGIPEDVRVAHKYGREVHVVADAGIVFTDRPFIVAIMTKGVVETEADAVFPELARLIFEFEEPLLR